MIRKPVEAWRSVTRQPPAQCSQEPRSGKSLIGVESDGFNADTFGSASETSSKMGASEHADKSEFHAANDWDVVETPTLAKAMRKPCRTSA